VNDDFRRLFRWLHRAQPPPRPLLRALLSNMVATATNVGLLVGAVALLVESARRPGLRAVAGVLIVIELLAFLRSPLRFAERLSSHRLGFDAVTRWRRWLVMAIGRWNFTRWRLYASGDLLERSLRDTDELQDLWLRCVIPSIGTVVTALFGDLVIALLPPHGQWWAFAGLLAILQLLGLVGLVANIGPLIRDDRALRIVRGLHQATLVELSSVTPELALLGYHDYVRRRCQSSLVALRRAEGRLHMRRQVSNGLAPGLALAALAVLVVRHPHTSPIWLVVVTMLTISTFDTLITVRTALDTAVAVGAAAERLEALDSPVPGERRPWPSDSSIRARHVSIEEGGTTLLRDASFELRSGRRVAIIGPSGSGKSTLLRALGALDDISAGSLCIGDTSLGEIDEEELRRHLIYVPSEPGLTRGYAYDVVGLGRRSTRNTGNDLAALGILAEKSTRWEELSRGERERVAIARAVVTSPDVYLLDDPTSGLGDEETRVVLDLLAKTGASVIVATHDVQVMAWCTEVFELRDGQLHLV
jgi:ABC-type transport system involved in cytochrome bd biosynthesis fused ATPase/permease subunit